MIIEKVYHLITTPTVFSSKPHAFQTQRTRQHYANEFLAFSVSS
jgi:hypothetical protein